MCLLAFVLSTLKLVQPPSALKIMCERVGVGMVDSAMVNALNIVNYNAFPLRSEHGMLMSSRIYATTFPP